MLTNISDFLFTKAYAAEKLNFLNLFSFEVPKETKPDQIFSTTINKVMVWVLAVVFLVAFIYLIINGFKYITAGGDAAKATEARNGVLNAIIGVVIVLMAYVILKFAGGLAGNLN